jgi:hypothetical protein
VVIWITSRATSSWTRFRAGLLRDSQLASDLGERRSAVGLQDADHLSVDRREVSRMAQRITPPRVSSELGGLDARSIIQLLLQTVVTGPTANPACPEDPAADALPSLHFNQYVSRVGWEVPFLARGQRSELA